MYVRSNRSMYVCMSKPKIMYSTCNPYLQSVFQYCSRKPASQPASQPVSRWLLLVQLTSNRSNTRSENVRASEDF